MLSMKLIMRFAQISVLSYLELHHRDLFWNNFGHAFIPTAASGRFGGRVELLEFWRTSPTFLAKEYNNEAIDSASAAGFVHVLEWWRNSGLPLKYSDASLEQASGHGNLDVLDWWRANSKYAPPTTTPSTSTPHAPISEAAQSQQQPHPHEPLQLRVGKSICHATQAGTLPTLRWWSASTIPFAHEDTIAKLASAHGHVALLDFWLAHRGPAKLLFDAQVLVAPTRLGHAHVLEWWRAQAREHGGAGLRVEYKTCDIEEALEDGGGGERGLEVRRWWARNGLNLGVGTSEWMRTKVLG
jgi:hypothetical protein